MTQQQAKDRQVSVNLNDLDDVDVAGAANGEVLTFNAGMREVSPTAGGTAYFDISEANALSQFTFDATGVFNAPAATDVSTESVHFDVRVAIHKMGPGSVPV